MSKLLVQLLDVDEKGFRRYIDKLEKACMHPGLDIKLTAELITKSRDKIRQIGLDISDTKPKEMYYALLHLAKKHDELIVKKLNIGRKNPEKVAKILATTSNKLSGNEKCLALTNSGTKKILKAVPPKKTLKTLKYRSLDSVLKRENPKLLYHLATIIEDKSWKSQIHAKMRRLEPKYVSWQQVEYVLMPDNWYKKVINIIDNSRAYTTNAETGSVVVLPVFDKTKTGSIALALSLLLQQAQNLSVRSLPYRQEALGHGFSLVLSEIAHKKQAQLVSIHGLTPSWAAVHELLGKGHIKISAPETEFVLDDLNWSTTETKLASLVSEMDFWIYSHYLAISTNSLKPVSIHLTDVLLSLVNELEYGEQSVVHFENSLWNEIQVRYLQEDVLAHSLVHQLTLNQSNVLV